MRISIKHNNRYLFEFSQISVSGLKAAGGYAFTFALTGGRKACDYSAVITDLRLSISLAESKKPLLQSIPCSEQLFEMFDFADNDQSVFFETVFTKEQVNAIEEARQEKDLKLYIGLRALVTADGKSRSSYDATDIVIPREHWLDALKNAGFRETLLFEIPLPSTTNEAAETISKAQEFIETGHYKQAVMQCRHLIEHIETVRKDKPQSQAANKQAQSNNTRKDMTSIERLLSLREQLKNVCQLGAHGSEEFTRSQAKTVLGMTMTLLAEPTIGFTPSLIEDRITEIKES